MTLTFVYGDSSQLERVAADELLLRTASGGGPPRPIYHRLTPSRLDDVTRVFSEAKRAVGASKSADAIHTRESLDWLEGLYRHGRPNRLGQLMDLATEIRAQERTAAGLDLEEDDYGYAEQKDIPSERTALDWERVRTDLQLGEHQARKVYRRVMKRPLPIGHLPSPPLRRFPLPWVRHLLESVMRDANADGVPLPGSGTPLTDWRLESYEIHESVDQIGATEFSIAIVAPVSLVGVVFRRLLAEPPSVFDRLLIPTADEQTPAGVLLRDGIRMWRAADLVANRFTVVDRTNSFARLYPQRAPVSSAATGDDDADDDDGGDDGKEEKKSRSLPPPPPPSTPEKRRAEILEREAQQRRDEMGVLMSRSERLRGSAPPLPPRRVVASPDRRSPPR